MRTAAPHRVGRTVAVLLMGLVAVTVAFAPAANAAVSSTGEINVVGDPTGTVPTASTQTLILTLLIDRSQAEPGEEIQTIEVKLPPGFTVTEDGIGLLKKDYLHFSRSAHEVAIMRQVKQAFDPRGIMNPGKIFDAADSVK